MLKMPSPADPFTILEHQNPPYDVSELHKISQCPKTGALELRKGRSGSNYSFHLIRGCCS